MSLVLPMGCVGAVGSAPDQGIPAGAAGTGAGGKPGGDNTGLDTSVKATSPGARPLRRLSRLEYSHSVRDLLREPRDPASDYPADVVSFGTAGFKAGGPVGDEEAGRIADAAEQMSRIAVEKLGALSSCDYRRSGEVACAHDFVVNFGHRAFRRALLPQEITDFERLFTSARTTLKLAYGDAIGAVIEAMLQSPQFLYHWELGPERPRLLAERVRLGENEIAARLSYFLWQSTPDDELLGAAAAGNLRAPAGLSAQAKRLLADPRARDGLWAFSSRWLDLDRLPERTKDLKAFPQYSAALVADMTAESRAFVEAVVLTGDGRLQTLLAAPFTYANETLARLYGASGITGPDLRRVDLDPATRAGVLTQLSQMVVGSGPLMTSPVRRGKPIREHFLCDELVPPPADVPPPPSDPAKSAREQFAAHTAAPSCAACHAFIDPIGWGLENFDPIGRHRTTDGGKPVDSRGYIKSMDGGPSQDFKGAVELAHLLASSEKVQRCVARHWLELALGRAFEDGDRPMLDAAAGVLRTSDGNLRQLLLSIVGSDAFLYRKPTAGEVLQ